MDPPHPKPVDFVGSTRKDLQRFPEPVRKLVGLALFYAQLGTKHDQVKPLKGFGGAGILGVIYVLHCFQKKSKTGIKTPQQDIECIRQRLKLAEEDWRQRQNDTKKATPE